MQFKLRGDPNASWIVEEITENHVKKAQFCCLIACFNQKGFGRMKTPKIDNDMAIFFSQERSWHIISFLWSFALNEVFVFFRLFRHNSKWWWWRGICIFLQVGCGRVKAQRCGLKHPKKMDQCRQMLIQMRHF